MTSGEVVPAAPRHVSVMLDEVVALLAPALVSADPVPANLVRAGLAPVGPAEGGRAPVLVDATLGLGGHAEALLRACPQAELIGLDRDPNALAFAAARLAPFGGRVRLVEAVYDELPSVLDRLGRPRVQAILLDLGLSSLQIDDVGRGFAYAVDAPLDMRMSPGAKLTAAEVLNTYSARDLAAVLRRYGEERFADRIAARVVAERAQAPFTTSARLVELVYSAIPVAARRTGGHPAKRTFQALRIEVNSELEALAAVLPSAVAALSLGGRLVVLAYHSLEDRLVKQVLAAGANDPTPPGVPVRAADLAPELRLLTRGAQRPSSKEVAANPRAESARLRSAMRINEASPTRPKVAM